MADSFDFSDPSDWHETSLSPLSAIDSGLRCQICKDFYTSAVLTSCSHTFCSLCIRRSLAAEGRCPTCRTAEQESRLRKNVAAQELADSFVAMREQVLKVARQPAGDVISEEGGSAKRKRAEAESEEDLSSQTGRRRSQRRKAGGHSIPSSSVESDATKPAAIPDSDDPKDFDYNPADDLVSCPICSKRMKQELVFSHLDVCGKSDGSSLSLPSAKQQTPQFPANAERLPRLNYSMMKEQPLRKKLQELGIPSWGGKPLLVKRHIEWINLWNANCDSKTPRPRKALLADLDLWERSLGGRSVNGGEPVADPVMRKDFDSEGWAKKNKSDFDALIADARKKAKGKATAEASREGVQVNGEDPGTRNVQQTPRMDSLASIPESASASNHDKGETPLPERFLELRDATEEETGIMNGVKSGGLRKVPMFELPADPITDSDKP